MGYLEASLAEEPAIVIANGVDGPAEDERLQNGTLSQAGVLPLSGPIEGEAARHWLGVEDGCARRAWPRRWGLASLAYTFRSANLGLRAVVSERGVRRDNSGYAMQSSDLADVDVRAPSGSVWFGACWGVAFGWGRGVLVRLAAAFTLLKLHAACIISVGLFKPLPLRTTPRSQDGVAARQHHLALCRAADDEAKATCRCRAAHLPSMDRDGHASLAASQNTSDTETRGC